MVTFDDYVKDLLVQIRSSYETLQELKDRPGDLDIINREWQKISGLLRAIVSRIDSSKKETDLYVSILKASSRYLDSYYFAREIQTMTDIYADDPNRLKNMRLKIIDSFYDGRFIDKIDHAISEL